MDWEVSPKKVAYSWTNFLLIWFIIPKLCVRKRCRPCKKRLKGVNNQKRGRGKVIHLLGLEDEVCEGGVHLLDKLLVLSNPVLQSYGIVKLELLTEVRVDDLKGDKGSVKTLFDAALGAALEPHDRGPVGEWRSPRHQPTLRCFPHALERHLLLVRLQLLVARPRLHHRLAFACHL